MKLPISAIFIDFFSRYSAVFYSQFFTHTSLTIWLPDDSDGLKWNRWVVSVGNCFVVWVMIRSVCDQCAKTLDFSLNAFTEFAEFSEKNLKSKWKIAGSPV